MNDVGDGPWSAAVALEVPEPPQVLVGIESILMPISE